MSMRKDMQRDTKSTKDTKNSRKFIQKDKGIVKDDSYPPVNMSPHPNFNASAFCRYYTYPQCNPKD